MPTNRPTDDPIQRLREWMSPWLQDAEQVGIAADLRAILDAAARQRARTCRDCVCGHCELDHLKWLECWSAVDPRCKCKRFQPATEQATGAGE